VSQADAGEGTQVATSAPDIVERWMRAQLILERQYFRALGRAANRREHLLNLLEMDIITQLPDEGAPANAIAAEHRASATEVRLAVNRLARRGLLRRERRGRASVLVRTSTADELIELIRSAQVDLMSSVLGRLDRDLQEHLLNLMESGALRPRRPEMEGGRAS
jgi:predicted transcriptional regulator